MTRKIGSQASTEVFVNAGKSISIKQLDSINGIEHIVSVQPEFVPMLISWLEDCRAEAIALSETDQDVDSPA